jgi:hypothetical protein
VLKVLLDQPAHKERKATTAQQDLRVFRVFKAKLVQPAHKALRELPDLQAQPAQQVLTRLLWAPLALPVLKAFRVMSVQQAQPAQIQLLPAQPDPQGRKASKVITDQQDLRAYKEIKVLSAQPVLKAMLAMSDLPVQQAHLAQLVHKVILAQQEQPDLKAHPARAVLWLTGVRSGIRQHKHQRRQTQPIQSR